MLKCSHCRFISFLGKNQYTHTITPPGHSDWQTQMVKIVLQGGRINTNYRICICHTEWVAALLSTSIKLNYLCQQLASWPRLDPQYQILWPVWAGIQQQMTCTSHTWFLQLKHRYLVFFKSSCFPQLCKHYLGSNKKSCIILKNTLSSCVCILFFKCSHYTKDFSKKIHQFIENMRKKKKSSPTSLRNFTIFISLTKNYYDWRKLKKKKLSAWLTLQKYHKYTF